MAFIRFFMEVLLSPICFLIILIVLLKIVRSLNSHTSMIMFYGKQIEEIRKGITAGSQPRRLPEASAEDHGLYEVLNE